jgi:hypothetical protein
MKLAGFEKLTAVDTTSEVRPTKRAVDGGDSAAFSSISRSVAASFSCGAKAPSTFRSGCRSGRDTAPVRANRWHAPYNA